MKYEKRKLLEEFSKIVKYGDFTLSSGKKSDFYIDCKILLLKSPVLHLISWYISDFVKKQNINFFNVAGITSGADPIVCSIVINLHKNGLFIRKQQKEYGTKKLIEGDISVDNKDVLIVDDVLTTGNSLQYSFEILKQHKFNPVGIFVLVDREENNAKEIIEKELNTPVYSIMTKTELFDFKGIENDRNLENYNRTSRLSS